MENRYEVRRGRFGAYFFDTVAQKEMDLAETVTTLNVLYCSGKISEQGEAETQPLTQQGSEPSEICPSCNGSGVRNKGDDLEYTYKCAKCNGTGKLLPC